MVAKGWMRRGANGWAPQDKHTGMQRLTRQGKGWCKPREAQVEDVVGGARPLGLRAHEADGLPASQQAARHVGACTGTGCVKSQWPHTECDHMAGLPHGTACAGRLPAFTRAPRVRLGVTCHLHACLYAAGCPTCGVPAASEQHDGILGGFGACSACSSPLSAHPRRAGPPPRPRQQAGFSASPPLRY